MSKQPTRNNQLESEIAELKKTNAELQHRLNEAEKIVSKLDTVSHPDNLLEDIFNQVLRTTKIGYSLWTENQGITYSPNCHKIFGFEDDGGELSSEQVFSKILPEDKKPVLIAFEECVNSGQPYMQEFRVDRGDGKIHWYLLRMSPLQHKAGTIHNRQVIGVFSNINRQKKIAEEKNREVETEKWISDTINRVNQVEHTKDAINYCLEELGKRLKVHRCGLRIREGNHPNLKLVGKWLTNDLPEGLLPPDMPANKEVTDEIQQVIESQGEVQTIEDIEILRQKHPDQTWIPADDPMQSAMLLPITNTKDIQGYIVAQDFIHCRIWTELEKHAGQTIANILANLYIRDQINRRLKHSEQRFRHAMNVSKDGLWEWHLPTNDYYISPSYYAMVGHDESIMDTVKEITPGAIIKTWIHPSYHQIFTKEISKLKIQEVPFENLKLKYIHKDGYPVWGYARTKCVERDKDGNVVRLVGVVSDITAFVNQQEELELARQRANEANNAKTEFLARMSHEIRTPMNAIIGMTHLMRDTELQPKQRDSLEHIDQAAQSLLHIINEILDFSKIEAGKLELENISFNIEHCLEYVSEILSIRAEQKDLEIIYKVDPNVPTLLIGDSLRLNQVLTNLVGNAIKFTSAGHILINIEALEKSRNEITLKFSVSDTGIGMSQEEINNLFNPFTQADGSTSRRFGGTGLGLSICKRLVTLMGGDIHVKSTQGEGSTFTFTAGFEISTINEIDDGTTINYISLDDLHTLVIDDNEIALDAITATAKDLKLKTESTLTSIEGIEWIKETKDDPKNHFDLVLIDYRMPDIDGLTATKMIKEFYSGSKPPTVIMISALDKEDVMSHAGANYVDGFITKPITRSRLYDAISNTIGAPKSIDKSSDNLQIESWEHLNGKKLLLVEDNIVNQKVAIGILKKQGVTVTVANNGQEAIDSLLATPKGTFDLILMDIEMPVVDGYQATRFIRSENLHADIPIIAMTAHAMASNEKKCLEEGMDAYISKPINPRAFYNILSELLT